MGSIRPLEPEDDLGAFDSGNEDLDRFLRKHAAKNQYQLHIGVTYVAIEGKRIVGFVTVAPGSIQSDELPVASVKKLPAYPLPILRLARLAIDRSRQRQGIGSAIVRFVFLQALEMMKKYGCLGVVVDAKPTSVGFYTALGFEPLAALEGQIRGPEEPLPLFMPIEVIQASTPP